MRVNTRDKFVFVSTPKACTHSIYRILDEYYSRGLVKYGFHSTEIPPKYRAYFRWTVVRNPYSRAASLWWSGCRCHPPDRYGFRKGCGSSDDFEKFVLWLAEIPWEDRRKQPLTMCQADWLRSVEPIVAIQMEDLADGLVCLPFWKAGIDVPRLNTSAQKIEAQSKEEGKPIERPPWQELCGEPTAQAAILRWASKDFERFGYSMEVP